MSTRVTIALLWACVACSSPPATPQTEPADASGSPVDLASNPGSGHRKAVERVAPGAKFKAGEPRVASRPDRALIAAGAGNLDVSKRLVADDIVAATGIKTELEPALLQGIKPSPQYGSARLAPVGRAHYGVGLQVWRAKTPADAQSRLALHKKTYQGAAPFDGLGRAAITAKQHTIRHLSWIPDGGAEVITLTCDQALCTDEQLLALARRVDGR